MTRSRQRTNPFYVLLIVTGLIFAITACGFGVMTFTDVRGLEFSGGRADESGGDMANHPLFVFLDKHGTKTLLIELAVLALATFGCIATDSWYERERASAGVSDGHGTTQSETVEPRAPVESLK